MSFTDHIESYLGEIPGGWKEEGPPLRFHILEFENCPVSDLTTYLSLGLSLETLEFKATDEIRHELLFTIRSDQKSHDYVTLLQVLVEATVKRGKGIFKREVIPISNALAKEVGFDALYCTAPKCFDDDFYVYERVSPPIVIVWLVPLFKSEVNFIRSNCTHEFEELLETTRPDLFSLNRKAVV